VLVLFISSCMKEAHFSAYHHVLNTQRDRMWKTKQTFKWHSAVHVVCREFLPAPMSCIWDSGKHFRKKEYICIMFTKFSILNLGSWVGSWNSAVGLLCACTHIHDSHPCILFIDEVLFTHNGINSTKNSHLWVMWYHWCTLHWITATSHWWH
jgi:hypothetical protein